MDDPRSQTAARPLILIVDDDPGIRSALERYLVSLGYKVALASNGEQGLRMAESLWPAVILTDVRMPVMDGHALLRRLTELGRNSSVVMMSGGGDIDDAIGAMRHGAVDYLKKPWTPEELATVVNRARGLSEALDQMATTARAPELPPELPPGHRLRAAEATVDGVALVEHATERATRERAIPPPPVAITDPAALDVSALRAAFPIQLPALRALGDRILQFTEARSLAMRGIAEAADDELGLDARLCQHAGLLLDVGALYLLGEIDAALRQAGGPIADVPKMRAALAARHTLVGGLILEAWGVDAVLVDLTHDHHATSLPSSTPALWCAAALGGALAVHLTGFGDPLGDNGLTSDMLARCAYRLGVGDTTLRRLTQVLSPSGAADPLPRPPLGSG